ncbi:EAL domain-containing response regulator [Limibacillus sp. MBR-115]|jgi:EAL domain-containing protein (putative c-di-GMP-specific phosphodiesterase class I)|uniref:EAL domain-containing response regulator n=1 Tax=Limibacillus sp. MBR-115 TaxID=3156465 RepID=UPI0033980EAC
MTRKEEPLQDRLLVIDDDADIRESFARIARTVGYESWAAADFTAFKELLEAVKPTHIMVDLQMPDVDGVQVLRFLAERHSKARIVIASGFDPRVVDVARRLARERGLEMAGTLSKPVRANTLRELLRDIKVSLDLRKEALVSALAAGQFEALFQPKHCVASGQLRGFEALARWNHPERGIIGPDTFIPPLEASDLIHDFTVHITRQACEGLVAFQGGYGESPLEVSVNLSASNLEQADLADRLNGVTREAGLVPECLVLEVTETVAMEDPVAATENLVRLRLAGFSLSMDDFGTGFSSLSYLRRMPFNEIKIDKSFVMGAATSEEDQAIIRAAVLLGKTFGMKIVAEGCEDAATLELLRACKCDRVQGYHFAKPLGLEDARAYAQAQAALRGA